MTLLSRGSRDFRLNSVGLYDNSVGRYEAVLALPLMVGKGEAFPSQLGKWFVRGGSVNNFYKDLYCTPLVDKGEEWRVGCG